MANKPIYQKGQAVDGYKCGDDTLANECCHIEVTASNSYRVYSNAKRYRTKFMYKGLEYSGRGILKITDTSGDALAKGIAILVF